MLVSDDCSSDNLLSLIESFDDPRIVYSRSDVRLGAVRNHNRAVSMSHGEYIVNLRSDDMILPNYLEVAGQALDGCTQAAAAYSSVAILKETKIAGCQRIPNLFFANCDVFDANPWLEKNHNVVPTGCMFRRSSFAQIGGYREAIRVAYDWDLYMRFMTLGGGVLFLPRVLAIYRKHAEQASQTLPHEGLFDVLDIWGREDYTHWPPWEIADLVLTNLIASVGSREDRAAILERIRVNGLGWRLIGGSAKCIRRRILRRMGFNGKRDENYKLPFDLESAVHEANILLGH